MAARVLRSLRFSLSRQRRKGSSAHEVRDLIVGVNVPAPDGARPAERGRKWADLKAGDQVVMDGKWWRIGSVTLADAEPPAEPHNRIESGRHWLATGRFLTTPPVTPAAAQYEPPPKPRRRLFSLRFYLFSDKGPAVSWVIGIGHPCPGAAHLVHEKPWREVEPGEEVRFGMGTYRVGAIALENCVPADEAGQLVRSGAAWLAGADSQAIIPPGPPRPASTIERMLHAIPRASPGPSVRPCRVSPAGGPST